MRQRREAHGLTLPYGRYSSVTDVIKEGMWITDGDRIKFISGKKFLSRYRTIKGRSEWRLGDPSHASILERTVKTIFQSYDAKHQKPSESVSPDYETKTPVKELMREWLYKDF